MSQLEEFQGQEIMLSDDSNGVIDSSLNKSQATKTPGLPKRFLNWLNDLKVIWRLKTPLQFTCTPKTSGV